MVVGASGGLGRALVEELASRGHDLVLVASDERDLQAERSHLRLKFGIRCEYAACHLTHRQPWLAQIVTAASRFERIDALFFPIGHSQADDVGTLGADAVYDIVESNFTAVAILVAHFLPGILARNDGCIVGFGSIAAIRGRKANIVYAAAKRSLASYFESLRHLAAGTRVRVQFYQIGYMDTQQSFGRKLLFPKCDPRAVARTVVHNLNRDFGMRYIPRFWTLVSWILKLLPWPIYKRLNF